MGTTYKSSTASQAPACSPPRPPWGRGSPLSLSLSTGLPVGSLQPSLLSRMWGQCPLPPYACGLWLSCARRLSH